ncbi:TetR/AcrR family transcriptional regulator [Microbacterium galbinum]|uniref:TetR/AcrR family transcriptional regulator n=1 Tax=Microbacterium galbinum TaxID=2851646 RepID=UPI001FFC2B94|nr:TetR/AcrR family transcriptional regulator [Microbacterium galbinum]MCK2030768.1 WHG domain-containing protein [Microbacterium galbinum]
MPAPERTSTEAIVAAGRAILEESGPASLTMQAVATRVGVRAPSLYKRVRDRDALLTAVAEAAIDELGSRLADSDSDSASGTGTGNSGADLTKLAEVYRAFAHEHPESFRLMFTASAPVDALHRASEPVLRAAAALVGEADALDAARLFTAWATGFLQMELSGVFRLGGDVGRAFDYGLRRLLAGLTA